MRHPYNPHGFGLLDGFAVTMFLLGTLGAITTSRWLVCRLCGFTEQTLYRLTAYWPLIMFLAWFLSPHYGGLRDVFSSGIAMAFGLAFSVANLRIASWYSRGLGAVFFLLYGLVLYDLFTELLYYKATWHH